MPAAADPVTGTPPIADYARRFIEWWVDELAALVPSRYLARPEAGAVGDLRITLLPDGGFALDAASAGGERRVFDKGADRAQSIAAFIAERGPFRGAVSLDAPRALCLVRSVTIPRRALRSVSALLGLDLEQTTPLKPADVLSDWFVEMEDDQAGVLHIRHVVLGRDRIASIVAALEAHGKAIGRLTVGHAEDRPMPVDLASSREPGFWPFLKAIPLPAKIMLAASVAIVCALPSLAIDRAERELNAIGAARQEAASRLASLPRANPAALNALARLGERPKAADLLDEIGGRLPAAAYLRTLRLGPDGVELGVSGDSGAISEAFAGSRVLGPGPGQAALTITSGLRP